MTNFNTSFLDDHTTRDEVEVYFRDLSILLEAEEDLQNAKVLLFWIEMYQEATVYFTSKEYFCTPQEYIGTVYYTDEETNLIQEFALSLNRFSNQLDSDSHPSLHLNYATWMDLANQAKAIFNLMASNDKTYGFFINFAASS